MRAGGATGAAHGAALGAARGAAAAAGVPKLPDDGDDGEVTTEDQADHIDDDVIDRARWMDTEIAVGSIVAILVVAAVVAVWISCRRRRRRMGDGGLQDGAEAAAGTQAETAGGMVHHVHTVHEVKQVQCRKKVLQRLPTSTKLISNAKNKKRKAEAAAAAVANGAATPNGVPVATVVLPSTPDPDAEHSLDPNGNNADGRPSVGPWEPYFLGLPGKKPTRARRRSVSLRSGDDDVVDVISDDGGDTASTRTPSRGPSPSPTLSPEDEAERARKRSVTFKPLVEEVQFLVK